MPPIVDVPVVVIDDARQAPFPRQGSRAFGFSPVNAVPEPPIMGDTMFLPDGLRIREGSFRISNQPPIYEQEDVNGCIRTASFGRPLSRSNSVPVAVSPLCDEPSFGQDRAHSGFVGWGSSQPEARADMKDSVYRVPSLMPEYTNSHTPPPPPPVTGCMPWQISYDNSTGATAQAGHHRSFAQPSWSMTGGNPTVPAPTWQPVETPRLVSSSSFNSRGCSANPWPTDYPGSSAQWPQYGNPFSCATVDGVLVGHGSCGPDNLPWLSNVPWQPSAIPSLSFASFPHPDASLMAAARAALSMPLMSSASEKFQPIASEGGDTVRRRLSLSVASESCTPQETPTLSAQEQQAHTSGSHVESPPRRPPAEVVHQPELPPTPSKSSKCLMESPEHLIRKLASRPLIDTRRVRYPNGVLIDLPECVAALMSVVEANAKYQRAMARSIENGELLRQAYQIYLEYDKDGNGCLAWQNGAIRDFVTSVFQHFHLAPPSETQIYDVYIRFDYHRRMMLNLQECLCLVDAVLRATFILDLRRSPNTAFSTDSNSDLHAMVPGRLRRNDHAKEFSDWDIPSETPSMSVDSSSQPRPAISNPRMPPSVAKHHILNRRRNSYHTHGQENRANEGHRSQPSHLVHGRHSHHSHSKHRNPSPGNEHSRTPSPTSPLKNPDLAAAAVAAAAAAAAAVAASRNRAECNFSQNGTYLGGQDALAEAKAETARLRKELQELRELESCYALAEPETNKPPVSIRLPSPKPVQLTADDNQKIGEDPSPIEHRPHRDASEDQSHIEVQHSPTRRICFQPLASPPDETLLWTARAHAENCRLEKELATLRDVARRQHGEVQWLSCLKASQSIDKLDTTLNIASCVESIEKEEEEEEEKKTKHEEMVDFTRRLRLLQQRERDFDKEREFVMERERAVRDQELQLALEQERQTVRSLMKERMLEQREWQFEKGMLAHDLKLESEKQNQPSPETRRSFAPQANMDRPAHRTFLLGSGYSAVDTEPEAEADAEAENEIAVAAAENMRLKQELEGLRHLAQLQRGEVDAALATRNVTNERIGKDTDPMRSSNVAQTTSGSFEDTSPQVGASRFQQVQAQSQSRQDSCIPTVPSPGASPCKTASKQSQSELGSNGYQRSRRSLMARVSERSGSLAAVALSAESTEQLASNSSPTETIPRGLRNGSVHQPFATRQSWGSVTSVTASVR